MPYTVKKTRKHARKRSAGDGLVNFEQFYELVLYAEQGVPEYWIIDPFCEAVEFFENRAGEFIPIAPDEQGRLHSRVLTGLWIKPEWLTVNPLPPVLEVLREILGEEKPLI